MNMYFTDCNDRSCRIDVDRIELIQQHKPKGMDSIPSSTIYLRGGSFISVQLTLDEFEQEISSYRAGIMQREAEMAARQTRAVLEEIESRSDA